MKMTLTPNRENIRLLVDALRSNELKQGKAELTTITPEGDEHCCLGVACIVAIRHGVKLSVLRGKTHVTYDGEDDILPEKVQRFYGFSIPDPVLIWNHTEDYPATVLNDDIRASFFEIADAFENTYLNEELENES